MAKSDRTKVKEIKNFMDSYGINDISLNDGTYLIKEIRKIINYKK